jgi:U4/U6.U5 tri-snRNP-associated protein 1
VVNIPLPTDRIKYGISSIIKEENSFLGHKRQRDDSISNNDTTINDTNINIETLDLEEAPLGKGIANALKVFRQRGYLGDDKYYGRHNDGKPVNDGPKEIVLEYRDEKGRLMTQKEAYRYICHTFHQNKPSLKKQEKRLKREQLEERNRNMDVSNTKSFKYLKSQQLKTDTPFVVLQGKNSINNL